MGTIFAIILIVASASVGFISLKASSITFLAISYSCWFFLELGNLSIRPGKDAPLCKYLSPREMKTYRKYHLHFLAPGVAQIFSSLLNGFRLAGFVWAGLCLWKGYYWLSGTCVLYFFITGFIILKFDPWYYMGAQRGKPVAIEELSLIERVQAKKEAYNEEQEAE